MVRRDYACKACGFEQEEFQSIKDDYLTICPSCREDSYRIVFKVAPMGLVQAEPKTLGVQALRNTKSMGNSEVQERAAKEKARRDAAIKARKEADGRPLMEKPAEAPSWRPNTPGPNLSLNSLAPEKVEKYIWTGEK